MRLPSCQVATLHNTDYAKYICKLLIVLAKQDGRAVDIARSHAPDPSGRAIPGAASLRSASRHAGGIDPSPGLALPIACLSGANAHAHIARTLRVYWCIMCIVIARAPNAHKNVKMHMCRHLVQHGQAYPPSG